jgi:hypothetical protein
MMKKGEIRGKIDKIIWRVKETLCDRWQHLKAWAV